ncbi:outer membrane protein assembly factor BamA [Brackiella oedipodis]|uniref:outer membrane protein assembly factor BamA n=1 Tax=Brackiella oedipodis TaxID=124225 RepID=UPI000490D3DA|nr:outer membrane protein assembly factor BamA [Brackiella oedipodis]
MRLRSATILHYKKLPLLLASAFFPVAAHAFSPFTIKDIQVSGLQSTEPAMVFSYLPVRVGSTFDDAASTDAVKRLYATGLFDDVKITNRNNVVQIEVKERPVISSILFDGMKAFNDKELKEALSKVGFGVGRALDPALLTRAEDEIRAQYIDKGRYGVDIMHTITPLPGNRAGISFQVQEGGSSKIRDIHIVGNKSYSESELLDEMNLTTPGWMTWYTSSDKFEREKMEKDSDILKDFYLDRGYLDFKVDEPQVTISPDRKDIAINYTIHEGKPYKINKIQLAGDLLGMDQELRSLIQQVPGDTYNNSKSKETSERIKSRLGELGYASADVTVHPIAVPNSQDVDVTFFVEPGSRIYVRRINIGGNTRTRDKVIRREMRQEESAWYDAARISTSRNRIDRLGYFNDVTVNQSQVEGYPDQVDINVDVKEKPTGMISLGVGYGSNDRVSFMAGISQDNIFGSGTDLSLQVNTGKYSRAVVLTHSDPYFTSSGISRTTSAYYRQDKPYNDNDDLDQDEDTYKIRTIGFGQNFGVPISENDRIFMGVTYENNHVKLPNEDAGLVIPQAYREFVDVYGKTTNTFLFNVGWTKDTRDSALAPTRGYRTELGATFGVGDLKYYILSAGQQYFLPINKDFTLAFNASVDWGKSFNSNKPFPVIKNLYAGGIGSVRGYEGSSLGPRDSFSGDYLGGSRRYLANVQLYMPFPGTQNDRTLRWFLFADAGKVDVNGKATCTSGSYEYGSRVDDPCGWRASAGIGLSWQSPLGPLEISYAKPLNSKDGDEKQQFQFQIGTSF